MTGHTTARLLGCGAVSLLPAVAIAGRLVQLQIVQHARLSTIAEDRTHRESVVTPLRGRILDRSGKALAHSVPAWSCYADPTQVKQRRMTARSLAPVLKMTEREILEKLEPPGGLKAPRRFTWLTRRLGPLEARRVKGLRMDGIGLLPEEDRLYPNSGLLRGLLGGVGADGKGLSGIEYALDKRLSPDARRLRVVKDGSGKSVAQAPQEEPQAGQDVRLTIDRAVQHYAEEALREAVVKHEARQGSILVQDPRTGELLAVAAFPPDPMKNPALQDAFEPGSTFKIVTAAAALEQRTVSFTDILDCEGGRWEVARGIFIKDHEPYRLLSLSRVMEKSSNIGMAKIGLKLGAARLHRQARAFGFGSRSGALPGESPGLLREPAAKDSVVLANQSFGQGVAATALQVVSAYSAIANGGVLLEPHLVLPSEAVTVRRVATPATIWALNEMLEGVVDQGTGLGAAVPGYSVAGKTGTAQKIDPATGKYSTTDYVSSFVGYAPSRDPRFTVLVVLDSPRRGYYGSDVAAPVFGKLVRGLLALRGVPPDRSLTIKTAQAPSPPASPWGRRAQ